MQVGPSGDALRYLTDLAAESIDKVSVGVARFVRTYSTEIIDSRDCYRHVDLQLSAERDDLIRGKLDSRFGSGRFGNGYYRPSVAEVIMRSRRLMLDKTWEPDRPGVNSTSCVRSDDRALNLYKPAVGEVIPRDAKGMPNLPIPEVRGAQALREVLAFRAALFLRVPSLVPPTALVGRGPLGSGSLQHWVHSGVGLEDWTQYPDREIEALGVLDAIIGQLDRGDASNYRTLQIPSGYGDPVDLLRLPDVKFHGDNVKHLLAIDHGLAFPESPLSSHSDARSFQSGGGQVNSIFTIHLHGEHHCHGKNHPGGNELSATMSSRIQSADPNELYVALSDLDFHGLRLGEQGLDGVMQRLEYMKQNNRVSDRLFPYL